MTSENVQTVSVQHAHTHLCSDEDRLLVGAVCEERHCCVKPSRKLCDQRVEGSFDVEVGYIKRAFKFSVQLKQKSERKDSVNGRSAGAGSKSRSLSLADCVKQR